MNAQLQAQETAEKEGAAAAAGGSAAGDDGSKDAPSAKRRRLASFFVASESESAAGAGAGSEEPPEVIVAVRKGNIVGTAFHPELTNDSRWHKYFLNIVKEAVQAAEGGCEGATGPPAVAVVEGLETARVANVVA